MWLQDCSSICKKLSISLVLYSGENESQGLDLLSREAASLPYIELAGWLTGGPAAVQ